MKYEIKIENAKEAKGTISLKRLAAISDSISRISQGALQIRLKGVSISKGRTAVSLEEALDITLSGIRGGSTCLELKADTFENTLPAYQLDIFRQEAQRKLKHETPVSLFIDTFREALSDDPSPDVLDKHLLQELKNLNKIFYGDETLYISTSNTTNPLILKKDDLSKIKALEENIPAPKFIVINGKVDLLQYSRQKVTIQTSDGVINGFLSDDAKSEVMARYWGKEVTLAGTAHYKPGGKYIIEIERIFEPSEGDDFFSKKIKSETIEQQIARQKKAGKKTNPIEDILGKWPGDETDEEFDKMLQSID